jgi:D-alanyl-D-alanine carboxypeptidase/D-alanyl-D-alanine-endopeptidase (penicillin-binding protein 4)
MADYVDPLRRALLLKSGFQCPAARAFLPWLALWGLFSSVPIAAQTLEGAIGKVATRARESAGEVSIHVVDVASGESIFEEAADAPRIIASNTKLFTTAAALDRLGPGFFFETDLLMRGERQGSDLQGDLAIVGGGDPNISGRHYEGDSLAVFRRWARTLIEQGVRRVDGDVFLVHGFFEPPRVHPDWPENQLGRWYEAPVEALSFNDNCILVRVWPGKAPGAPARIEMIPDLGILEVRNSAQTTSSSKRHKVIIDRVNGSSVLNVSGAVYQYGAPFESWVTVADPLAYFSAALRRGFEEEGLVLEGRILFSRLMPVAHWEWVTGYRTDLMTTAEVINKRSQNFFAESLLKLMGAALCGEGSWEAGREVVAEFLTQVDILPGAYEMADGSGMSRENRFTARQLTALLRYMYFHERGRDFLLTLPYSGEPGLKWEHRLAEDPYRGNVFAKTGSLLGVSTLSGYVKARSGKIYAFSILCNRTRGNWLAQKAQDEIVRVIVDEG